MNLKRVMYIGAQESFKLFWNQQLTKFRNISNLFFHPIIIYFPSQKTPVRTWFFTLSTAAFRTHF